MKRTRILGLGLVALAALAMHPRYAKANFTAWTSENFEEANPGWGFFRSPQTFVDGHGGTNSTFGHGGGHSGWLSLPRAITPPNQLSINLGKAFTLGSSQRNLFLCQGSVWVYTPAGVHGFFMLADPFNFSANAPPLAKVSLDSVAHGTWVQVFFGPGSGVSVSNEITALFTLEDTGLNQNIWVDDLNFICEYN